MLPYSCLARPRTDLTFFKADKAASRASVSVAVDDALSEKEIVSKPSGRSGFGYGCVLGRTVVPLITVSGLPLPLTVLLSTIDDRLDFETDGWLSLVLRA